MPEPSDDTTDAEVEHAEAPAAEGTGHATRRVHLRPAADESKEEFAARLLAAVMDRHRASDADE